MVGIARLKRWFFPKADVPEEEARHVEATALREQRAAELREQLKTNPDLQARIDDVTRQLAEATK